MRQPNPARWPAAVWLLVVAAPLAAQSPGTARQITHAINDSPSSAPDGERMVYITVAEGREQLFVRSIDGKHVRQITRDAADHEDPAWSPDGRLIAFASNRDGDYSTPRGDYQIFVMRPDGSDVRLVAQTTGRATAPQWSRDGRIIYFPICRGIDGGFDCQIYAAPVPSH